MQERPRIVDLFCGCGGFSLGAREAGLAPVAAFDMDPILTSSYEPNHHGAKLVLADLSTASPADIVLHAGGSVDGIFGGPPCQAFSDIGHRRADDPRRSLIGHFFRLVAGLRPAFFVMENVKGLGYADARPVLDEALAQLPGLYKLLGPVVLDAADFGAATRRPRLFVIGYDPDRFDPLTLGDIDAARQTSATVREAIGDLGSASPVCNTDDGFDVWRLDEMQEGASDYARRLRNADGTFTGHRRTAHTSAVTARFDAVVQGGVDTVGRHARLTWDGQCPTLRAGTGSDRGSFQSVRPIHPDEPRVITVREAARLQGFPDRFRFHPTIWHSYRMIGNSVSPFMSKAIFSLISKRIELPRAHAEAAE